jgi:nicotinamidase-related amidase
MSAQQRLDPTRAVLVIVDMQGRLADVMHESESIKEETARMVRGAGLFDLPVLCLEQLPDKLGHTTPKVAEALNGAEVIAKQSFSAWREPAFAQRLRDGGRTQVLLAGMESHVCVYQTGMDLLAAGYQVFALTDCISSRRPTNRQLGLSQLERAGASLTSVEMALFEFQGEAAGERFREMIQLIR